jgi:PAS domain-containing protein
MVRLSEFAEFFQGEVNETNERARGNLVEDPDEGALVTRGASICLYVARPASQGRDLYLNVAKFLDGKDEDAKAFHHRYRRVCWQESSAQNNFRRVIAALVPKGEFCNHKVNYLPEHTSKQPLEFVLGLLNSKLTDWYFRLGSTNAAVSHYQVYNLPCPRFEECESDAKELDKVRRLIRAGKLEDAFRSLAMSLSEPPFGRIVQQAIVEAVRQIIGIENGRGDIRRVDRSALDPHGQPFQDFIDRLLYAMAGIDDREARGLEARLAEMM